jgi:hypothetical protein
MLQNVDVLFGDTLQSRVHQNRTSTIKTSGGLDMKRRQPAFLSGCRYEKAACSFLQVGSDWFFTWKIY